MPESSTEGTADAGSRGMVPLNEVIKPSVSSEQAKALLLQWYGLDTVSIKPLVSYDDLNFHVKVTASTTVPNPHLNNVEPCGYILKVLNSMDSALPEVTDAQNAMMSYLGAAGYRCPVPVPNVRGETICAVSLPDALNNAGKTHLVRLLRFVSGSMLAAVPLTPPLCRAMGAFLAGMQRQLQGFSHPTLAGRQFIWMGSQTPAIRKFEGAVTDPHRRSLLRQAYQHWESKVAPVYDGLPRGFVHGDFNEQNIIVEADETGQHQITGVIDFGDVSLSPYVHDLAITVMALLTLGHGVQGAGECVGGYTAVRPLTEPEWGVLWECVVGRLYASLAMGAYSHSLDTSNTYVLTTAQQGWAALEMMLKEGRESVVAVWRRC